MISLGSHGPDRVCLNSVQKYFNANFYLYLIYINLQFLCFNYQWISVCSFLDNLSRQHNLANYCPTIIAHAVI